MLYNNEFQETLNMFRNYVGIDSYVDFSCWNALPIEYKAAGLYICFYPEITLAWYKAKQAYPFNHDECDAVSTMMQYLQKNVPIIEADPSRYTHKYIYRVAFNCLDCVTYSTDRRRVEYALVSSSSYSWNTGSCTVELDLSDMSVVGERPVESEVIDLTFTEDARMAIWDKIDELDARIGKRHLVNRIATTLIDGKSWTNPTYSQELVSDILLDILDIFLQVCISYEVDTSILYQIYTNCEKFA